jgi:effector-binding domain-containing protein
VIGEPGIEERPERHYVAIREQVSMEGFGELLAPLWDEVFASLRARGVAPDGPPLIRYGVIDMARQLEIEVGAPVAEPMAADGRVVPGVLPAGRYARLTHTGDYSGLIAATAALQDWAEGRGMVFDQWTTPDGDAFGGRVEWYVTDPGDEPDPAKWETEVAYRLADSSG